MKENGFTLKKDRSRRYPVRTITDADYADDIALLANTPAQAESLLHSLERAADGIGLHVNADTTAFMYFNQRGDISTVNGRSLKRVDKLSYLGSSVSSTENDINTRLAKAWTAFAMLRSHIHEYGHVRNRHVMFINDRTYKEHRNLGIRKHVTTSCSGTKPFY